MDTIEESQQNGTETITVETVDTQMREPPKAPAAMVVDEKKRPKLDLNVVRGERKRGKSMFGVLLNTLNKAKAEDKERNASEAAKKRHLIEQRLQSKLKKETDSVRKAEEAKKDKVSANRKEEDLQLKDSIYKLRRTLFPQLASFLSTADVVVEDEMDAESDALATLNLSLPQRSHPPPLFYLPAILTSAQEAFLSKRREQTKIASEKEWGVFREERSKGIEEIAVLRRKAAEEEEERKRLERDREDSAIQQTKGPEENGGTGGHNVDQDVDMEVDEDRKDDKEMEVEGKETVVGDDDEVEY